MDGTVSVLHRGKEVLFKGWQHYWLIQLRPADLLDLQSESVSPTKTLLGAACVNVYDPRASLSESRAAPFLGLLLQGIGWVTLQKRRQMETRREEGAGWRVWWAPFKMGDRNVLWRVLCILFCAPAAYTQANYNQSLQYWTQGKQRDSYVCVTPVRLLFIIFLYTSLFFHKRKNSVMSHFEMCHLVIRWHYNWISLSVIFRILAAPLWLFQNEVNPLFELFPSFLMLNLVHWNVGTWILGIQLMLI